MSMFNSVLPPAGSRAVLLGRYSSHFQNPLSADDQIAVLRQDCARLGWQVVGEFTDKAKSGRSVAGRAGYLEAMATAEAGGVDVICVFHLDRLGRNSRELHDAKYRLKDVDAVIYTHGQGVMDRFQFAIYAEMAQIESERISERTRRGRRAAAERGRFLGDAPYGYRLAAEVDANGELLLNSRGVRIHRLEVDPVTGKVVLRANLEFHAGKSPHRIAATFTSEGIPTPEGGPIWHPNTIIGTARSMTGLLRNPIIVGKVVHGKVSTTYNERTGRVQRRQGNIADRIEHDAPHLRIVPQEIWDDNQERLARKAPSKLRDRRRPSYPLSGLCKCGVCGGAFNLVSTKMGCAAHKLKACPNGRRVKRDDLERVVLEGLTQRLRQPIVMAWFFPEYVRERGPAKSEAGDRYDRAVLRRAEVVREIDNLVAQIKAGAGKFAAVPLNESLEILGAEKEGLERTVRGGRPSAPEILTPEYVTQRFNALMRELGPALQGDERDAFRARDILRSLITEVTITPYNGDGRRPDGRGTGAVRVQVEGEVSRLIDQALLDRKIMHKRGASLVHDLPIATFKFYVDLDRRLSPEQEGLWTDAAALARLLDDAEWPIPFHDMIAALNDREREPTALEREIDETRARIALAQFRRDDWVRSIRLGQVERGWVWNERGLTDDQWRARYERRAEYKEPIGVIRVSPPSASVMIIGARSAG